MRQPPGTDGIPAEEEERNLAHLKFTLVSMCVPNLIKIGGGREFHWLISYGMTQLSMIAFSYMHLFLLLGSDKQLRNILVKY